MREPSPHKQLFWEYQGQLAVREGDWKLVLNGKLDFDRVVPDQVHLSDLSRDPGSAPTWRTVTRRSWNGLAGMCETGMRKCGGTDPERE